MTQKILTLITLFMFITSSFSQELIGKWETYDDKTGEKKSIVEIYNKEGAFYGKVIEKKLNSKYEMCVNCKGDKYNRPIIGLEIIEGLRYENNIYSGGTITDPETGNVYKCKIEFKDKNTIKVRGFIGFSIIGRTQYWSRSLN